MDLYEVRGALSSGRSIYDLPLRVAFYARVSTDKDEQLHSLSAQVEYYTKLIQDNPNWSLVEGYIDEGLSGTSVAKRESFLRMMQDAQAGRFDFIVTKEISRFSRSTLDSIRYTQQLLGCGVGVLFQSDNINTLLPDAELRLTIMSSIAQDEVRKISERVRFGFKRAVEQGVVLGNSRIWGYTKSDGALEIVEEEAQIVQDIYRLYAVDRLGMRRICQYLSEQGIYNSNGRPFSPSTVKSILTNPKYKGCYCGNKTHKIDYRSSRRKQLSPDQWVQYRDEEHVPPIVTQELWERANRILQSRSGKENGQVPDTHSRYPYSGKLFCAADGETYYRGIYRSGGGKKEVWQCKRYCEKGREGCSSPPVYTAELDEIMRDYYRRCVPKSEHWGEELVKLYEALGERERAASQLPGVRRGITERMRKKEKLLDLSVGGRLSDDDFEEQNRRLNGELSVLRKKEQELLAQSKQSDCAGQSERLRERIRREMDFPNGFSIALIDAMLDRAEVTGCGQKGEVRLTLFPGDGETQKEYHIARRRGKPSVCTASYT
ncbi:MAG: recombinase family protein [Clostridiales bacterium]|nr:recombinase family protein [Clostridiales bacterium]